MLAATTSEHPLKNPSPPNVELDRATDWPDVLAAVRDYWLEKHGARSMPSRGDISPSHIKAHLPHILLADVIAGGQDFRYRLVGHQLSRFFYSDPTGKLMTEALAPFGTETVQATIASYRGVVERRAPVRLTGSGSVYGQNAKHFDAFLAPLSEGGTDVNMILGTFVFLWDSTHPFRPPPDPGPATPNSD
jgi:hypothetical protein